MKIRDLLCMIAHSWKYYKEIHSVKIEGLPHIKELDIKIRECKRCGYRESHTLPSMNGIYHHWRSCNFKPGEILILTQ